MNSASGIVPFRAIDARAHLPRHAGQPGRGDENLGKWFGSTAPRFFHGGSIVEMAEEMDQAGVDRAVLVTAPGRSPHEGRGQGSFATSAGYTDEAFNELCEEIADCVRQYPDRFVGMAMLDPMGAMTAVRQAERAVLEYGFGGCAIMPALIGVSPGEAIYYPVYSKCAELSVPLTLNVGVPGPVRRGSVQMPRALEDIALAFGELRLIATHVGHPWHDQMLSLVTGLDNVYLMTSAWAPKHIPATVVECITGAGSGKIMWASDYPLLPFGRCLEEIAGLGLPTQALHAYVWGAAERLFWAPEAAPAESAPAGRADP